MPHDKKKFSNFRYLKNKNENPLYLVILKLKIYLILKIICFYKKTI